MAVLYGGSCFETAQDAATAAFSAVPPVIDSAGQVRVFEQSAGVWLLRTYDAGVLVAESPAPSLSFAVCDLPSELLDATVLAWGIVGAWVAAWAINQLRRSLA